MKNSEPLDQLMKQALSPTVAPSEELNDELINQLKEMDVMKTIHKKRMATALIAATITLAMSITAFAAINLLSSDQVADHLGNRNLARAFSEKNAIEINESATSGGFRFTLLGIVSGKGLSDFTKDSQEKVNPDRTYAVVSIANEDGSKMPTTQDEDYGKVPFFISPLIKGQKPWEFNIASMNGGYNDVVIDGVMYRLIECDGVEMFADRGLYLCISTTNFYDINAFNYDEKTGEISPKKGFDGANVIFHLPLDKSKADFEKGEKYLKEIHQGDAMSDEPELDLDKELEGATVIAESVKEVTYDEEGKIHYEYDGNIVSMTVDSLFQKDEIGVWSTLSMSEGPEGRTAVQFSKDEKGVITGRVVKLK